MSSPGQGTDAGGAAAQDGRDFIRPYAAQDRKMVEQLVGQGYMEGLTSANKRVYLSLPVIALVVGLGYVLNRISGTEAPHFLGVLGYAQYLIGPCIVLLPTLVAVEWIQRPSFDAKLRRIIGGWDMATLDEYYGAAGRPSGAWVFEHKGEVVGVVMLDALRAGQELGAVLADEGADEKGVVGGGGEAAAAKGKNGDTGKLRNRKTGTSKVDAPTNSRVAEIRHLDVNSPLRRNGVGTELLGQALDTAFGLSPGSTLSAAETSSVERVVALTSPFTPGGDAVWRRAGFTPLSDAAARDAHLRADTPVGLRKWTGTWYAVDREGWIGARERLYAKFAK